MLYDLLVLAHVILFAYWLGGDLGVFYASRFVSNPDLGREARKTAAAIMLAVDMSPRICMVLILPTGLHLAAILFYRIYKHQRLTRAMITGRKPAERVAPESAIAGSRTALALILIVAVTAFSWWLLAVAPPEPPPTSDFW